MSEYFFNAKIIGKSYAYIFHDEILSNFLIASWMIIEIWDLNIIFYQYLFSIFLYNQVIIVE